MEGEAEICRGAIAPRPVASRRLKPCAFLRQIGLGRLARRLVPGRPHAVVATLAMGLLSACSIPMPQAEADPTRFYVLSSNTTSTPAAANSPVIHLREIELATYLKARPIIVRRGDNEIEFREYARWGEALELGIGRVLREELLARGAASAVLSPGLRTPGMTYDRELTVRILAAEGTTDGNVVFRAVWDLTTVGAKQEAKGHGDYRAANLKWDGHSEAALVARLSEAVAGLAADIATVLGK